MTDTAPSPDLKKTIEQRISAMRDLYEAVQENVRTEKLW